MMIHGETDTGRVADGGGGRHESAGSWFGVRGQLVYGLGGQVRMTRPSPPPPNPVNRITNTSKNMIFARSTYEVSKKFASLSVKVQWLDSHEPVNKPIALCHMIDLVVYYPEGICTGWRRVLYTLAMSSPILGEVFEMLYISNTVADPGFQRRVTSTCKYSVSFSESIKLKTLGPMERLAPPKSINAIGIFFTLPSLCLPFPSKVAGHNHNFTVCDGNKH